MKSFQRSLSLVALASFFSACSGGGSSPRVTTSPVGILPTTTPASPEPSTSPGTNEAAFACPSSDTAQAARIAIGGASVDAVKRRANAGRRTIPPTPGRLAVTYDLATLRASHAALVAREAAVGGRFLSELDFTNLGVATRVLAVSPQRLAATEATLRRQPGVRSVALAGARRAKQTVTTPDFTNDPYFTGFAAPVPASTSAGATAPPSTYEVGPYEESAGVPGQWNMHAIGLENAFAYSENSNGSGRTNANASGSKNVKIAIIDVGEDTTHPELHGKIAYQKCFITDPSGAQSTSNFTTDEDGHGTDVSGLAAAATNNALGFAGAGGNSVIYAYRVQATPDDDCADPSTTDSQCTVDTTDIASAIEDAIAQHVDVISLSLGGGACNSSGDEDSIEGAAIADAIAANVVVVAAAGNDGSQGLEAPACDAGVIAAGASALADGQSNGTGSATGSASSPNEYVASYSDYGSPGKSVRSANAWGIVAPGGDPSNDVDPDDLHWITDIWTSTPFDQKNFGGYCGPDYPGTGSTIDCQTEIAGTSMSAPTVAGAAALIIAVNSSYRSPAKMKQLLCTTADDIGDSKEGCGRLNVYRAMATVVGDAQLP